MKKRRKRKNGFARTKRYPLLNHPAYYRKKDTDNIEYVTFTHLEEVDLEDEKIKTIKLIVNICKTEKEIDKYSYVVPRVYIGKRSSLKDEIHNFSIDKIDKPIIVEIFNKSERYPIKYTNNSKNKKTPK